MNLEDNIKLLCFMHITEFSKIGMSSKDWYRIGHITIKICDIQGCNLLAAATKDGNLKD